MTDMDINEQIYITGKYPRGCRPPNDWWERGYWMEAQHLHGLTTTRCARCDTLRYPQELKDGVCRQRSVVVRLWWRLRRVSDFSGCQQ